MTLSRGYFRVRIKTKGRSSPFVPTAAGTIAGFRLGNNRRLVGLLEFKAGGHSLAVSKWRKQLNVAVLGFLKIELALDAAIESAIRRCSLTMGVKKV